MELNNFNKKGQSQMPSFPALPPLPGSDKEHEYDPSKEHSEIKNAVKHSGSAMMKKQEVHKSKHAAPKKMKKEKKHEEKKTHKAVKHVRGHHVKPSTHNHKSHVAHHTLHHIEHHSQKHAEEAHLKTPSVHSKGEVLEKYELEVDGARVKTEIRKDEFGITYNLYIPEISEVTSALLDEIRNELIAVTTVSMKELTDPASFSKIKKRFKEDARRLLAEKLPHNKKEVEDFLVGMLMQEMLGLGEIEFLVADPNLEEIVIPSAKEHIRVYFKKHGWLITNIRIGKEEQIVNYSNIIARRVGKQITVLSPLLDAHLVTGDRINAVLYPVNTKGNTITIRKFARDPFTIIDMINSKTCSLEVAALLWLAIEYEMNVLFSGGTGSGKTSFLNACMPFIPPNQRIISIEDTRELTLPDFLYWTPLVTRTPNPEGKGEVSMLDLLVNCLRMRPDRVILGEMRREKEAMVLFEAMHTGHSVCSTVHADTAPETISRLTNPPLNVPPNLLKAVNLNVVMFRDRRKGIRRVLQVAEFEADKVGAKANILYRWAADRDEIIKHSESSRFFEDISRNTGMTEVEVARELKEKKTILEWLIKNGIRSLEEFGRVTNLYYRNKELLMKAISQNNKSLILKEEKKMEETKVMLGGNNKYEDEESQEDVKDVAASVPKKPETTEPSKLKLLEPVKTEHKPENSLAEKKPDSVEKLKPKWK